VAVEEFKKSLAESEAALTECGNARKELLGCGYFRTTTKAYKINQLGTIGLSSAIA
jgi:hypothetical protein